MLFLMNNFLYIHENLSLVKFEFEILGSHFSLRLTNDSSLRLNENTESLRYVQRIA